MNNKQYVTNNIARIMTDVCYMKLSDNYAIVGGYDYNENSLFRYCRKRLNKLINDENLILKDIKELIGDLYSSVTIKLCDDIVNKFKKEIERY